MSDTLQVFGTTYTNVAGFKATDTSDNVLAYVRPTGTLNITSNDTYDVTNYASATVNVSGGGGTDRLELLATQSLGTISTASTSSENTGQSVIVSGVGSYDLLIVETSVDTIVNGRHAATIAYIPLMNSSNIATKSSGLIATVKTNIKFSSSGVASSRAGTTAYGIYPNSISLSSGTATMPMYQRYNSSSTGTINGAYTVRVYGVNLYDLIGG